MRSSIYQQILKLTLLAFPKFNVNYRALRGNILCTY